MGREVRIATCKSELQVDTTSWGDLYAVCRLERNHDGLHEGPNDNGTIRRWNSAGREVFRTRCDDMLQVDTTSWGDLRAYCTRDRKHAGLHEGPDDNGTIRRWKND